MVTLPAMCAPLMEPTALMMTWIPLPVEVIPFFSQVESARSLAVPWSFIVSPQLRSVPSATPIVWLATALLLQIVSVAQPPTFWTLLLEPAILKLLSHHTSSSSWSLMLT